MVVIYDVDNLRKSLATTSPIIINIIGFYGIFFILQTFLLHAIGFTEVFRMNALRASVFPETKQTRIDTQLQREESF